MQPFGGQPSGRCGRVWKPGRPVWVIKNGRMVDLTRGKRRKGRGR